MGQSIHVIQVGYENCHEPYFTKDYDLEENDNRKAQVCYSSGDHYDADWRRPKKEYKTHNEH